MSDEVKPKKYTDDEATELAGAFYRLGETNKINAAKVAQMKFHVVAIPDSGDSKVSTFDTREDMIIFLRSLDPHTSVRIFEGLRWQLLKGSPKQLQTPDGSTRFDIFPRDSEIDEDGRLDGYDSSRVMNRILKPSMNGDHLLEGATSSDAN